MSKKKKLFEVGENETIDNCLERMEKEGYKPVKRKEKPIFIERNGEETPVIHRQVIIFEGEMK